MGAAFAPGRSGRREMVKERSRVACETLDVERENTEKDSVSMC